MSAAEESHAIKIALNTLSEDCLSRYEFVIPVADLKENIFGSAVNPPNHIVIASSLGNYGGRTESSPVPV